MTEKRYGTEGKLVFDRQGNPKIIDRPGYPFDLTVSNQSIISVWRRRRWQDLLADYDGEDWQFKTEKGTVIPLQGQYRARLRIS